MDEGAKEYDLLVVVIEITQQFTDKVQVTLEKLQLVHCDSWMQRWFYFSLWLLVQRAIHRRMVGIVSHIVEEEREIKLLGEDYLFSFRKTENKITINNFTPRTQDP